MAEAVEVLRRLLRGEEVTFNGEHYALHGVRTMRARQEHVPFLVAVNGRRALAHAARHADIIGLTMLGRTLEDGHHHETRWQAARLDATLAFVREQAGHRWPELELNALVQRVIITDDRSGAIRQLVEQLPGLAFEDAVSTPFLAIGTHEEIAEHLRRCRERWGISYFSVRDVDAFAPVIARLRGSDAVSTVHAWHAALNAGDVEQLIALSTREVEVGGPRGRGRGTQLLRDWFGRAGIRLEIRQTLHRGNTVVVEQVATWQRPEGATGGEPETVASVFTVKDGRVDSVVRYPNLASALEASGLG
jgi:ketosteroid isomerase-like protein